MYKTRQTRNSLYFLRTWAGAQTPAVTVLLACAVVLVHSHLAHGQEQQRRSSQASRQIARAVVPEEVMLRIMRAEDERRWDTNLTALLSDENARVRHRAALAAGRIGDERAVTPLIALLQRDEDAGVRAMAAFALGEIESAASADAVLAALHNKEDSSEVRARALEALGKIAAALPKAEEARARILGEEILKALAAEDQKRSAQDHKVILIGLTAALRARPTNAGLTVAKFLSHGSARVRADAANALARLRAKDAGSSELRALLLNDADAIVRANAARALGAAEDKAALDALVDRAMKDSDERVRISAIRALGTLKDARAAAPLLQRVAVLFPPYRLAKKSRSLGASHPRQVNELLEIASTLGRILASTGDEAARSFLRELRDMEGMTAPEVEIAFARVAPATYLREWPFSKLSDEAERARLDKNWKQMLAIAQGLGEIATITTATEKINAADLHADAQRILRSLLDDANTPALAVPDVLRSLAAFKPNDLSEVLRRQLGAKDVIVRATAAELLGELAPDEGNARALTEALPLAMRDELNDAALAILDALGKQKSAPANDVIKSALDSSDHLVRRRAVALLKANDAGDFSSRIGTVMSRNTLADYRRALERHGKQLRALVSTTKGSFMIELLPDDAPLTVDSFVQLARRGFFNGLTFHRVVPNFVIQGGDPRGDGNGGPGYQIRCEINEVPYIRGAVGMALSGKDTGGSQWFVTHSPQPHLDGGYTVFGRVAEADMNAVDDIARGDVIRRITITENSRASSTARNRPIDGEKKKRR